MRKKDILRFGSYIKSIRLKDERQLRQLDVAKKLGMSLSFYSEIENSYRRTLDAEEMEIFAELFNMTEDEKIQMYDLASYETNEIPVDLEDMFMDNETGKWAKALLRKAKEVKADEKMWKKFIWELEKKGGDENGTNQDNEG